MNKRKVAVGPGAASLILIAVVLSLCILAVLTMISARSDDGLGNRSVEMVQQNYNLNLQGEKRFAELDALLVKCRKEAADEEEYLRLVEEGLPEGMEIEEDRVFWEEIGEQRKLRCAVRLLPAGSGDRTEWLDHSLIPNGMDDGMEEFEE